MKAATRLEYRPLERQLSSEARASKLRQRQIGKWYSNLAQTAYAQVAPTQADYGEADRRLSSYLGQVGAQDTGVSKSLDAQDAASAALRGAPTSTDASRRENAGAAQRGLMAASYGGMIQGQGANQTAYLRRYGVTAKHEGVAERLKNLARTQSIRADQRELAKAKGDFRTKYRADARQAERDYHIQLKAFNTPSQYDKTQRFVARQNTAQSKINAAAVRAQAQAGITKQEIYSRAYQRAAKLGLKGDKAKAAANRAVANSYANQKGGGGGGGSQDRRGSEDIGAAVSAVRQLLRDSNKGYGSALRTLRGNHAPVLDYLVSKLGYSRPAARRAIKQVLGGGGGGGGGKFRLPHVF